MLETARSQSRGEAVDYVEADLREITDHVAGRFGGAICLGNTLPHILTEDDLERSFAGVRQMLDPGAPLLIQLLNYHRIITRDERHLPLNIRQDGDEEIVFLRLMRPQTDGEVLFYPTTLRLVPGADPPLEVKASKEVRLKGWREPELARALRRVGFTDLRYLGSYARDPFDPEVSRDLIVVAR
jgi:glycine/sarcosine N-methyltransferase